MTARVIRMPQTPAGRQLLREAAILIGGWGRSGGPRLEDFDWDTSAVEDERLFSTPPLRGAR